MLSKKQIKSLIENRLDGSDAFLVDLRIDAANKIEVEVDTREGVSIQRCVELSRFLESELDNETNDFELLVSSPGLDKAYKVYEQYEKNIGREVALKLKDGGKQNGQLLKVDQGGIVLTVKEKKAIEGKKKKQWVTEELPFTFNEIEETKTVISFK
jgi:ribosome maturation factor RimP